MDAKNKPNRFIIIHAHMYQPPREDPFTGDFDFDFSAKPYDCWNHRIAMECYFPNLYGRIYNKDGDIIEMINNYEYLNFDFGPTLLNWIELKYPSYYKRLIECVKKIKHKTGFSPQISCPYNHTILPLDSFITQFNQIYWGIKDFFYRLGFYPDGMWLSETAVNENVLKILIDHQIKYIILAPHQIKEAIELKTQKTIPTLPNEHYIWFDRDKDGKKIVQRSINIFTYDPQLSRRVAFENLTFNSEIFTRNISESPINSDFILIATDGETFGHHQKFADLTLSYSFRYEFEKYNLKPISISEYLSTHEPKYEATLEPGIDNEGTSWSCSHGVRRWKGGCPCGDEKKYDTSWRFAFRLAAKWLDRVANDIYFEEGKKLFEDPLSVRKNYIDVWFKKISLGQFIKTNLKEVNDENIERANKILTMIKYQMLSLTSCGWFFNDISRIEAQQNMKYSLKAITILEELGYRGIEKCFLSILEIAKSNFTQLKDGNYIYEKFVKPSYLNKEIIHSYLVLKTVFLNADRYSNVIYDIKTTEKNINSKEIAARASITNREEDKEFNAEIIFNFSNMNDIKTLITYFDEKFEKRLHNFEFEFKNYSPKIQLELLKYIAQMNKEIQLEIYEKEIEMLTSSIQINRDMAFENFEDDIRYFSSQLITMYLIKFMKTMDFYWMRKIEKLVENLENIKFEINYKITNDVINLMPNFVEKLFNLEIEKEKYIEMKNTLRKLNLSPLVFHIENIIFEKFNATNK